MLEYSCIYGRSEWSVLLDAMDARYVVLNITAIGAAWSVLLLLCVRPWLASLLLSIISGIVAIINHYVLQFHGMPLSFLLIKNLSTAMGVISGYDISVDSCVVKLIAFMAALVLGCLLGRFYTCRISEPTRKKILKNVLVAMCFFAAFYFCFMGENPLKPKKTISWHWKVGYEQYGYAACSVESFFQLWNFVNIPDGYSEDAVQNIEITDTAPVQSGTPDVILILNETLYDLKQIADIQTDIPYWEDVYGLDNLISGYAVTPSVGGGTNSSEYELLTSNSLELMPGVTPFNVLDLQNAHSIVSFMNALGYHTIAGHSASAQNYSRGIAYPALGFEESHFIEDYTDMEGYHNRAYTDESSYANLIRWYEEAPEDQPRFMYMLTYQNHGSYDQNDPEHDIVHIQNDYGENTQLINEFLSSVSLSDQAFCSLVDYFSSVDRQVIICMVGDHSPNFASSIVSGNYSEEESLLRLRKVPLLYWANFELEDVKFDTLSMNHVVPTLLELANMERSPYYNYLIQIRQDIPVLSSYGRYYDVAGNMFLYDQDDAGGLESMTENYFFLEYYNLRSSHADALFSPCS